MLREVSCQGGVLTWPMAPWGFPSGWPTAMLLQKKLRRDPFSGFGNSEDAKMKDATGCPSITTVALVLRCSKINIALKS